MSLSGRLKGEKALFECSPDYAEGATIEVLQMEDFEAKDVFFKRDKAMMMKSSGR